MLFMHSKNNENFYFKPNKDIKKTERFKEDIKGTAAQTFG